MSVEYFVWQRLVEGDETKDIVTALERAEQPDALRAINFFRSRYNRLSGSLWDSYLSVVTRHVPNYVTRAEDEELHRHLFVVASRDSEYPDILLALYDDDLDKARELTWGLLNPCKKEH